MNCMQLASPVPEANFSSHLSEAESESGAENADSYRQRRASVRLVSIIQPCSAYHPTLFFPEVLTFILRYCQTLKIKLE